MPQALARIATTALLALAAAWGNAQTGDWGDVTIISSTAGNNPNRLCMGVPDHMRPADIGCPSYAPSLSTAGHVSITGNVSANKFIGDGSGLTNLNVQGDRIISNTHAGIVNENTGYISLTTSGGTWGYFSAGWSYLANLFTNTVSSSLVSATNVSATFVDATRNGTVSGTYGYFRYISGTDIYGRFTGDGSGLTGVTAAASDRIISGTNASTRMVAISDTGYISITQVGANSGWFDPYRGLVTLGVSATGPISGTRGYFSGPVGIGTDNPLSALDVRGQGEIRVSGTSAGLVMYDRSVGTRRTVLYRSGNKTHLWDTDSSDFRVSLDNATGNVGLGTVNPLAKLDVAGTISASDAIQVGSSSLSCGSGIAGALRYAAGKIEFCNGTSWGALAGAGDAMGDRIVSGTTNAIAWQDRSLTITTNNVQRMIVGEDGNVGIGTSTPNALLDVAGPSGPSNSGPAVKISATTTNTNLSLFFRSSESRGSVNLGRSGLGQKGNALNVEASGDINFYAGGANQGAESMVVDETGNVGIRTISPTATLQVSGTFAVSLTGQSEPSLIVDGDGRVGVRANQARQSLLTVGPNTLVDAPASSLMVKESSGTIGNAANSYVYPAELQYQTSGGNTARLLMSGYRRDAGTLWTGTGYRLQYGVDNSFMAGERAYIELGSASNGDGRIMLGLHNADRLIITTNTIVASGTVSVTNALQLGQNTIACATGVSGSIRYNTVSNTIQFCNGTAWTSLASGTTGGGTLTGTGSATAVTFWNGSSALTYSDGFYWDNANKRLGIGTNAPAQPLWVSVTTADSMPTFENTSSSGRMLVRSMSNAGNITLRAYGSGYSETLFDNSMARSMALIGVTSNSAPMIIGSYFDGPLVFGVSNSEDMRITAIGNVGIGRTAPLAKLDVNGTISASNAIQLGQNTIACVTGVSGSIRYNTVSNTVQFCNGTGWTSLASGTTGGGTLTGTGSATAVAFWNGANALTYDTDGFYWDATNNRLGVGTNTPSVTLNLVANQLGAGTMRTMNLNTQGYAGITLGNHTNESVGTFTYGNANSFLFPNAVWVGTRSNTVPMVFTANGSDVEDMRLSNGRLGVGTSSATATLQVSGSFTVSTTGQDTTPTLYTTTTGRVGVGTSNPQERLHVGNDAGGRVFIGQDDAVTRRGLLIAATTANEVSGSTYPPYVRMTAFSYASNQSLPLVINPHGSQGFVSIGKFDPKAMLDVQGTISASNAIQVGQSSLLCSSPISGSIRYNTTSDTLQVCTGSGWKSLVSGTTGGGGGGLTGTGSATAVAFWSGSNALTFDSGLYWDNINKRLGVGTGTPLRGLEVKQANDDVLSGFGVANAAANSRVGLWVNNGTGHLWSGGSGQSPLALNSGGGFVGIGTEYPAAALTVSGTISATGAIQVGQSTLACASPISGSIRYNTTSNTIQFCNGSVWTSLASGTTGGGGTLTGTGSATAVAFWSGSNVLSYDSGLYWDNINKRLGIGSNVPQYALDVSNSVSGGGVRVYTSGALAGGFIVSGSASNLALGIAGIAGHYSGISQPGDGVLRQFTSGSLVLSSRGSGELKFGTGASTDVERMRITALGRVGVGTASPTGRMEIVQDVGGENVLTVTQASDGVNAARFELRKSRGTPTTPTAVQANDLIGNIIAGGYDGTEFNSYGAAQISFYAEKAFDASTRDTSIRFQTAQGATVTEKMRIMPNGNVGIGTSQPSATLTVSGTISATNAIQLGQATIACGTHVSGSIRYNTTSNTVQFCNGTIWASLSSGTTGGITGTGSATAVAFWNGPSGLTYSDGFYWDDSFKRLAVGSTSATTRLHVEGTNFLDAAITQKRNSFQWNHLVDVNGNYLLRYGDVTVTNDNFYFTNTGRLGIGTTVPAATLQVSGTFTVSTSAQSATRPSLFVGADGNVGIGSNNPTASLSVEGTTQTQIAFDTTASKSGMIEIRGGSAGVGSGGGILFGAFDDTFAAIRGRINDASNYGIGSLVFSTRNLTTDVSLTERMRIDVNGNIGVNRANPLAKLDVAGTISASNAIQVGSSSLVCSGGIPGAIRYSAGTLQLCDGTSWGSLGGGGGATDRITNGTVSVTVNANGYVSLTTGVTDWGYLSSGVSYLPNMHVGNALRLGAGNVREFATTAAGAPTSSDLIKLGEFVLGGDSRNVTIVGEVLGASGSSQGITRFVAMVRSNTLPSVSLQLYEQNVLMGGRQMSIRMFYDGINKVVLTATPNSTLQSMGWKIRVYERANYNGWTQENGYALFDATGHTETQKINGMILNNGMVGIGGIVPTTAALEVSGSAVANAFLYSSDRRLKQNIVPLTGGLSKLDAITPVTFSFISDTSHTRRLGVIAQEVEKAYPQAVVTGADGYKKVDYPALVPALIGAVKELSAENQRLRREVDAMKASNLLLKAANDNSAARLDALERKIGR